jgi:hypothetical protein
MLPYARMTARGAREWAVVTLAAAACTLLLTWPLGSGPGRYGRTNTSDGQWSIWVVNWVARTLVTEPARLYHANIFHPNANALAYSEPNIGAGVLAVPAWLLTRNPYATHNSVVLFSFVWAAVAAYGLTRHLTANRVAAAYAGIAFAFCPFTFARFPHIQLLMTGGLPTALLAMHRFADRPSAGRAAALGAAIFLQALCCGYYGFAAGLTVGFGLLFFALTRGRWAAWRYWALCLLAAAVAVGGTLPFLWPTLQVQETGTLARTLEESTRYSADWRAWLASSAWAHRWMLPRLGTWKEVLFPGFLTTTLAGAGLWLTWRRSASPEAQARNDQATPAPATPDATARDVRLRRDTAWFYALVAGLGFWITFGPGAGLYGWLYRTVPMFSLLRAPARFGILVTLALAVLAAFALAHLARRSSTRRLPVVLAVALVLELATIPLRFPDNSAPINAAYKALAVQPRGAVVELPFFWRPLDFHRHAHYMLFSTYHWQPLVNGYSDYYPPDFRADLLAIASFPTRESFPLLQRRGVTYAVFHLNFYDRVSRASLMKRLEEFAAYLRPLTRENDVLLFEIVGAP